MRFFSICLVLVLLLAAGVAFAHTSHRSWKVRHDFEVVTGYPHGRFGWIIDHVIPLACNGPDVLSNLQWETVQAAKDKDRWERRECRIIDGRREGCCK